MQSVPVIKDLVLLGGGHSHIAVLKSFGMRPIPGVRLTLISRDIETAYSGMLPGLIAGHYSFDQAHIDLVPLARFAGARFFHDEVTGIDPVARTLSLANRPPVSYDVLSINTGSTPSIDDVSGAGDHVVPVKPINRFLGHWESLRERIGEYGAGTRIGVVGGGTGGVELCLSVHHALTTQPNPPRKLSLELLTADGEILQEHPGSAVRRFRRILAERGIEVHTDTRVTQVMPNTLIDDRWPRVSVPRDPLGHPGRRPSMAGRLGNRDRLSGIHGCQRPSAVAIPRKCLRCRRRGDHGQPSSPEGGCFRRSPGAPADPKPAPLPAEKTPDPVSTPAAVPEIGQYGGSLRSGIAGPVVRRGSLGMAVEGLDRLAFHGEVPGSPRYGVRGRERRDPGAAPGSRRRGCRRRHALRRLRRQGRRRRARGRVGGHRHAAQGGRDRRPGGAGRRSHDRRSVQQALGAFGGRVPTDDR